MRRETFVNIRTCFLIRVCSVFEEKNHATGTVDILFHKFNVNRKKASSSFERNKKNQKIVEKNFFWGPVR